MATLDAPQIRKVAFIGNHVPRQCGIATFTSDLANAVLGAGVDVQVVALDDQNSGYEYPPIVRHRVLQDLPESYRQAAAHLNRQDLDVVCVQHEFGIYGGSAGAYLLLLLRELKAPIVTTLHTILKDPTADQFSVTIELSQLSERLIVMSVHGRKILEETYRIPASKIEVIPHGIPVVKAPNATTPREVGFDTDSLILTFGLIGPSKGIEHMIEALPSIVKDHPGLIYAVAGTTHPRIVADRGEEYRHRLRHRAAELGVAENLKFVNRFLPLKDLTDLLQAATIYVTPYLNAAQITSGTLAYAFGCGNAVVSTPYWHAEELLAEGRGVLVPFADSQALSTEICALLDDRTNLEQIQVQAFELGRDMQWPHVGQDYVNVFAEAHKSVKRMLPSLTDGPDSPERERLLPELSLTHLLAMTDGVGVFQHATYCVPNRREGYCTDDNARAAIFATQLQNTRHRQVASSLQVKYLSFMDHAFNVSTERMRNFMSSDGRWLEDAGSDDSHGRALWSLGHLATESYLPGVRSLAIDLFDKALPSIIDCTSLRAWCYAVLGLSRLFEEGAAASPHRFVLQMLAHRIHNAFTGTADASWLWFEDRLTYDNARIPQALLLAGNALNDRAMVDDALISLDWLRDIQMNADGQFHPIGSDGFYLKGGIRAEYDQQPLEAAATIDACHAAHLITGEDHWLDSLWRAFAWFRGDNSCSVMVCDDERGACYDGVTPSGVNKNQGAESTLAYLSSALTVQALVHGVGAVRSEAYLG